jgi:uncharacterized protein
MTSHEFPIPVSELDAGGKEYRFPIRPAWVRGVLENHEASASDRDGTVAVRASKSGHDVVVNGKLEVELQVPCARCLEPFSLPIRSDLRVLYAPAAKVKDPETQEYEFSEEEADTLPFDGETVALDDLVRDELLLEIPMIPLCSEGCPGMSTRPESASGGTGADSEKGLDPRLAPLLAFRDKAKT